MLAGREPRGREPRGRVPNGRVKAQRYGRRRCRGGSVPPLWRAASSSDIVNPRSGARAPSPGTTSATPVRSLSGSRRSAAAPGEGELAGEQLGGERDPGRP
ncbi:hypothetical protein GCM10010169_24950 [Micromonospora fulviviridis]|nr:hypothetical protein GCM10010169_24950 [Micromonospora fulviviridis]